MERRRSEPTLIDAYVSDLGDPKIRAKLARLDAVVPWERLAVPIRATYDNDTAKGGRPNVPVVMMLKVVMLQKWFNLSDPAMEGMLLDRISFREFVGLNMTDATIDETTIVKFRGRLREHGLMATLFDDVVAHLTERGLIVEQGTLVDATIIEAPRGKKTEDSGGAGGAGGAVDGSDHTKQKSASYTKKHGRTYFGFKAHIATDRNAMIKDYVFDTARVHDSRHMDQLIEGEKEAAYADSAYMDQARKQRLEDAGVFCGIIERRVRGQGELTDAQKAHNRRCASLRAFVEHPFAWIKRFGGFCRTRYRGLERNALDFGLAAIAYNFERSLSIRP
jgi:IS5 family transposase